jgi:hypothetical protein
MVVTQDPHDISETIDGCALVISGRTVRHHFLRSAHRATASPSARVRRLAATRSRATITSRSFDFATTMPDSKFVSIGLWPSYGSLWNSAAEAAIRALSRRSHGTRVSSAAELGCVAPMRVGMGLSLVLVALVTGRAANPPRTAVASGEALALVWSDLDLVRASWRSTGGSPWRNNF